MSEDEAVAVEDTSDTRLLTAEYRDGQLQIVEVTPFEKNKETHIVPDQSDEDGKYTMVETDKGLMQLDLLNLTLVRCEDGEESYQLVAGDGGEVAADGAFTCVMQSSDSDDHDNQESYVMMEGDRGSLVILQSPQTQAQLHSAQRDHDNQESYVMMEGDRGSLVILQSPQTQAQLHPAPSEAVTASPKINEKPATPAELLQKAKAMKKAKTILAQLQSPRVGRRGRKPRNDIPPPHELLASPNFKLYLYSCKLCSFKCNATKELTAHKGRAHGPATRRAGRGAAGLQCARCPYKAITHAALENHMKSHPGFSDECIISDGPLTLDSVEVANADVLVCGACGFESGSRDEFRRHIELAHGVVAGADSVEVANADVLVCGACGFESGSRDEFRRHIELAHGVVAGAGS